MLTTAGWNSQDPTREDENSRKEDGGGSSQGNVNASGGPRRRARPVPGISQSAIPEKTLTPPVDKG